MGAGAFAKAIEMLLPPPLLGARSSQANYTGERRRSCCSSSSAVRPQRASEFEGSVKSRQQPQHKGKQRSGTASAGLNKSTSSERANEKIRCQQTQLTPSRVQSATHRKLRCTRPNEFRCRQRQRRRQTGVSQQGNSFCEPMALSPTPPRTGGNETTLCVN